MLGTYTSNGDMLDGSFLTQLTLTQSLMNNSKSNNGFGYAQPIQTPYRDMMSPIPEMNSSKGSNSNMTTIQSKNQDDERKLTGNGNYNLD